MSRISEIPVAIVGMACRLPGADDLDEFWKLLDEGRSGLGKLPADRFDRELQYSPEPYRTKSYTDLGGVVTRRPFDAAACPLPPELLRTAHTAHLTLLEVAADGLRNAGYDPFDLPRRHAGVYIGHTPPSAHVGDVMYARQIGHTVRYLEEVPGFAELPADEQTAIEREIVAEARAPHDADPRAIDLCANASHGALLISHAFGLDGPAMSFDAACASSMRALGHAVRALQRGRIDMAVVGGASFCQGDTLVLFSQAQSVSRHGSRPFDEEADGLVASEGYVILVLKTLDRAEADGDRVLAVIRGLGVSSDGKGKSLWAPRKEGQIEAIRRAYGERIGLGDLQYMEMHATSTQVGDATELSALADVFQGCLADGCRLPIGSVKANVGHTLETAGLASLCKTVLAMQHGRIPPQIGIRNFNTKVDWDSLPFFVPREGLAWNRPAPDVPRRAAVNAFGIGGLNVHVVLEEHLPQAGGTAAAQSAPRSVALTSAAHAVPSRNGTHAPSPAPVPSDDAVAIVGRGAVLPGIRTIEHLWDVLQTGEDQRTEVDPARWDSAVGWVPGSDETWTVPITVGGFVRDFEYDWKKHKVPPKQVASADPLQFMLLDAADQALRDSGYDAKPFDRLRAGVIVGTVFGGEFGDQLQMGLKLPQFQRTLAEVMRTRGIPEDRIAEVARKYEDVLLAHMPALVDETGSFTASTLASRITKTFDLMGGAVAVDGAEASSYAALESCVDILLAGDCDMMICAAGQRAMDFARFEAMARRGMLARHAPCGPFDARSDGGVFGEGVAVLVLKRLSDALRDGDTVHGIVRGIAAARGRNLQESIRTAVERAMHEAGTVPDRMSVLEAGSFGDPAGDRAEAAALAETYATTTRTQPLLIGALAAQIGNTAGASGLASVLKASAELSRVEMPRNVGCQDLPELQALAPWLITADRHYAIPAVAADGRLYAGVSGYSQGDLAYHVVLEGPTRVPCEAAAEGTTPAAECAAAPAAQAEECAAADVPAWRIVRVGAETVDELLRRLADVAADPVPAFEHADERPFGPRDRHRAAFVVRSAADLASRAEVAAARWNLPEARPLLAEQGTFLASPGPRAPRIAFLFPGQGSQYAGMLKMLAETYEPARAAIAEIDEVFARCELPSFADICWSEGDHLGKNVWWTQIALLAADTVLLRCAESLGLRPDRVAGHSFGELAALVAAGAWDFEEALRATFARCAAIEGCAEAGGALVSTSAPDDVVERLCAEVGGRVWISHRNSPEQTVAGGDPDAVRALAAAVEQAGYKSKILDVPAAFHTPLMDGVREPFAFGLEPIRIEPPHVPVLSSVTVKYVADPADIRDNLVVQMTQPVPWTAVARRLADEGIDVFVEVGPKQVLTGLHKQILGDRAVHLVGTDHPKRNGLQQLLAARACVEAAGGFVPVEALLEESASAMLAPAPHAAEGALASGAAAADAKSATHAAADGNDVRVLVLSGTPYEMGLQHGRSEAHAIRAVLRRCADLAGTPWDDSETIAVLAREAEALFGPEGLEELDGIAAGAEVSREALVAYNLRLFREAGGGGAHFAVTAAANPAGGLVHAANEDLQPALCLQDCLVRHVQLREPAGAVPHATFAVPGQVGGLNGINAHGLTVTSSALLDVSEAPDGIRGPLQSILVKRILERATTLEQAIDLVRAEKSLSPCGLCIAHAPTDRLALVEFDGKRLKVLPTPPSIVATNHRLLESHSKELPGREEASSHARLERLRELLGGERPAEVVPETARQVLRDRFDAKRGETRVPTAHTVRRVDNQISVVMRPAAGEIWVTPGPSANGHQDEYRRIVPAEHLPTWRQVAQSRKSRRSAVPSNGSCDAGAPPVRVVDPAMLYESLQRAEAARPAGSPGAPVCDRFALRVVETGPATEDSPVVFGTCLVLGENAVSAALVERLCAVGATVYVVPSEEDVDAALAQVEAVLATGPVPHLFLTTPWDADAVTVLDEAGWRTRRQRGVFLPYLACQKWFQAQASGKTLDRATLAAAVRLGGDFGCSSRLANVEGGALTGLLKGVQLETDMTGTQKGLRTKVVDADAETSADEVAAALLRELGTTDGEVEVGLAGGRRYVVRPQVVPASELAPVEVPHGATFVVTGGARGVTAVVAAELGRRFGAKLHLIGSSPLPEIPAAYHHLSEEELKELKAAVMKEALADGVKPIDAWAKYEKLMEIDRNLRDMRAEGLHVVYHACDVSDRTALAAVLESVRAQDGPIAGIVHGAGFERASRFEKKQRESVDRTIAAKVDGAVALLDLTRNDPVRWFVGFGSVSGRFGGVGQTDYCLANDLLAKLCDFQRSARPECASVAVHWHAWDDVGMAVRPESQHIRKLHDIRFMPSREGAAHLLDELAVGAPEGEIVVTERTYYGQKYFPNGAPQPGAAGSVPGAASAAGDGIAHLPLIDRLAEYAPLKRLVAEMHLDPVDDVFLSQHRYKGRPLLPVVIASESLAQAASLLLPPDRHVAAVRNIEIVNGLRFPTNEPQTARIRAEVVEDGVRCELVADFANRKGQILQKDKPYLRGLVETCDQPPCLEAEFLPEPDEWHDCWYPEEDDVIYHGMPFRCLRQVGFHEASKTGFGRLRAPHPSELGGDRQGDAWFIPAALLDACFFACGICLWVLFQGVVSIPNGIRGIRLGRPPRPGEECLVQIRYRGREGELGLFDFDVRGDDGSVVLLVEGYQNVIVAEEPSNAV